MNSEAEQFGGSRLDSLDHEIAAPSPSPMAETASIDSLKSSTVVSSSRLSLAKCKSLLGRSNLTDSQVLELRDAMYDLANVGLETFTNRRQ
jgi:hypothetical protein